VTNTPTLTASRKPVRAANQRRVAAATLVGTTIEFYDFFVFGTASALVFGPLFFAPAPPAIALILSMATFGVSFIMRPVGGFIAGHLGDRYGRKIVLVWTLLIMGGATAAIGLLPGYAQIGILAPLLLIFLRLVQGVAVGGEWGGAATMAIENAPANRRGMWGALPQMGGPGGLVLANIVTLIVTLAVTGDAFLTWGWRIPFLVNVVLIAIGLWVRLRIEDEVGNTLASNPSERKRAPILDVLRERLGATLKLIGAQAAVNISFYLFAVLAISYLTITIGFPNSTAILIVVVGAAVDVALQPVWGRLSDSIGRKPVMIIGAVITGVLVFPYYLVAQSGSPWLIGLMTVLVLGLGHSPQFAVLTSLIGEQYDVTYRYSGASIANQMGNLVWAAATPVVGVALLTATGGAAWPLALLLLAACVLSLICIVVLRETSSIADVTKPTQLAV
jgi:MHS family shikimate/dehydroshikimate transporter-like MFS transporter